MYCRFGWTRAIPDSRRWRSDVGLVALFSESILCELRRINRLARADDCGVSNDVPYLDKMPLLSCHCPSQSSRDFFLSRYECHQRPLLHEAQPTKIHA